MRSYHEYSPLIDGPQSWRGPDKRVRLHKGDGGGTYYENANKLYGVQADTAGFMLGIGKENLPGAVDRYSEAAQRYEDPAYAERMAGQAATTAQNAIDQTTGTLTRNMGRYGFNPASGKFAGMMRQNAIEGAAIKAGAVNQALSNVEDKKFGAAKDFYSSMVGIPSDAASQAGNAASGFASIGNAKQNQANNDSAALGNVASLGYMALTMKDGGEVKAKRRAPRMAMGGLFQAGMQPVQVPTAPVQQQQQIPVSGMKTAAQLATQGPGNFAKAMSAKGGKIMENVGNWTGNTELAAEGLGTQATAAGQDLTGAIQAYKGAGMNDVASGLAAGAGDAGTIAMQTGAEQGAMLAAQEAGLEGATAMTADALGGAAATEAAGGLTGALAGASAAMPWLAAGVAVGSMLGLFADGGEVDRENMLAGGKVDGPGGPRDDKVPAWLSDGEFVVNAKAVKMPGVKQALEKINAAGKQGNRHYADGGFVNRMRRAFGGEEVKPTPEQIEMRKSMARRALGDGMLGKTADTLKNRNTQIELELKRQMGE